MGVLETLIKRQLVNQTLFAATQNFELDERTEVVNSQLTYRAKSSTVGSAEDDAVWQIWREVTTLGVTKKEFARVHGAANANYIHKWSERTTLFPAVPLSNPASLLFDGVNDYVTLGDNFDFGPAQAFSWSFWMKAANFSSQRAMIAKTTQDANVFGYSFQHNSSGKLFSQWRASGSLRNLTFSSTLNAGQWYHICFTYAGGSNVSGVTAYIDGSAEPSAGSGALNDWGHTDPCNFGNRGNTFHFSGNLNQISVWDKELSSAEVTEIYNSGSPDDLSNHSAVGNLQSWWGLNDNSSFPTETDLQGSINGTLTNMDASSYDDGDVP